MRGGERQRDATGDGATGKGVAAGFVLVYGDQTGMLKLREGGLSDAGEAHKLFEAPGWT